MIVTPSGPGAGHFGPESPGGYASWGGFRLLSLNAALLSGSYEMRKEVWKTTVRGAKLGLFAGGMYAVPGIWAGGRAAVGALRYAGPYGLLNRTLLRPLIPGPPIIGRLIYKYPKEIVIASGLYGTARWVRNAKEQLDLLRAWRDPDRQIVFDPSINPTLDRILWGDTFDLLGIRQHGTEPSPTVGVVGGPSPEPGYFAESPGNSSQVLPAGSARPGGTTSKRYSSRSWKEDERKRKRRRK